VSIQWERFWTAQPCLEKTGLALHPLISVVLLPLGEQMYHKFSKPRSVNIEACSEKGNSFNKGTDPLPVRKIALTVLK
jgi:hypothetical protein